MKKRKVVAFVMCGLLLVLLHVAMPLKAQITDVDQLSDEQLIQYMNASGLNGLSEEELEIKARQKGVPAAQIAKLKARLPQLQAKAGIKTSNKNVNVQRDDVPVQTPAAPSEPGLSVFGSELFSNANLTFEPNLKIATPRNYVLGVDDELVVDVFGYSENTFKLKVQPEGHIRIPNLGPVRVVGLTMEDAQKKIRQALSKIYTGINAGNTSVQVSLGQIRSIKVTLIGHVQRPGTFSLSSLSTIANALYNSGGINGTGSYRNIQLIRNGKTVVTFDLYDFLNKGDLRNNLRLEDDDIIKVNPYQVRVTLSGGVKRPAIYEAKTGEKLADIIAFAGDFTDDAYTEIVRVSRFGAKEKLVLSISEKDFAGFALKSGDVFVVDNLVNRYQNRVSVEGAVFHPGDYSINDLNDLKSLLLKAGLREDAYLIRGIVKRLKPDYTPQFIDFNVSNILSGKDTFSIKREDVVSIFSVLNLKERFTVSVNGEINKPGTYEFSDSLKLKDLLLMAGGFTDAASSKKIEISRRFRSNAENDTIAYAVLKTIALDNLLLDSTTTGNELLEPFDIITVRKNPSYREQVTVFLEGEVMYPGQYTLLSKDEKLSDLIARAGGLKSTAYAKGAVLLRNTFETVSDQALMNNKIRMLDVKSKDTLAAEEVSGILAEPQKIVGIRLNEALANPGSLYDLRLMQGDMIKIPKRLETVQAFGGVFVSKKIVYRQGLSLKDVVNESGGFTSGASRKRSYVVYPNGEVRSTKKFLFFNNYPEVKPGSEVYVPMKSESKGISGQELTAYSTGIVGIAAMVLGIINLTK